MIVTHPYLFNAIVVFFIAFTAGWMVYAFTGRRSLQLTHKLQQLEKEKEAFRQQAQELEAALHKRYTNFGKSAPVISLTSTTKPGKSNSAGF